MIRGTETSLFPHARRDAAPQIVTPDRRDSLGREIGNWREEYQCQHCRKPVIVRLYAAWPEQCPHCKAWSPALIARAE